MSILKVTTKLLDIKAFIVPQIIKLQKYIMRYK